MEGIELFRKYMRLEDEQFRACLTAAVTAGIKVCHKPIIFFEGPTDVGKTTRACFLVTSTRLGERPTADSIQKNIFAFPRNIQDHHLISSKWDAALYDDIQTTDSGIYKMICLTSTGGSMPVRKLYTDQEILAIGSSMLVVYTGLSAADMPPDLLNRHIILHVEAIPDDEMEDEDVLLERFCAELPLIHGAISYLRERVRAELANKAMKRPPIPRQCRLRAFARAGFIISYVMGWPNFIDDYASLMTQTKDSVEHDKPPSIYERRGAVVLSYLIDSTPAGAAPYVANTSIMFKNIETKMPAYAAVLGSAEALGKILKQLTPAIEMTGRKIMRQRVRGTTLWSISSPALAGTKPAL